MDATVSSAVDRLLALLSASPSRILVGVAGIPGSGKSSFARHLCAEVNGRLAGENPSAEGASGQPPPGDGPAIVLGMDGWHLTRAQLDAMEDPQLARDKRGAPWTFDAKAFSDFIVLLRDSPSSTHRAPTFSHSLKDPVFDALAIEPSHRLVIVEGLYCCAAEGQWRRGAEALDARWVVEIGEGTARERLVERHVQTGVAKDQDEAEWRADNNDLPNGRWLLANLLEPTERVRSVPDPAWAGEE